MNERFGMRVFERVGEAILAGYQVYHQAPDGVVLRKRTRSGEWLFAIVRKIAVADLEGA